MDQRGNARTGERGTAETGSIPAEGSGYKQLKIDLQPSAGKPAWL